MTDFEYCLFGEDAERLGLPNAVIVWATEHDDEHKRAAGIEVSKISLKDVYVDDTRIAGNVVLTGRSYKICPHSFHNLSIASSNLHSYFRTVGRDDRRQCRVTGTVERDDKKANTTP